MFALRVLSGGEREQIRSRADEKQPRDLLHQNQATPTRSQLPSFVQRQERISSCWKKLGGFLRFFCKQSLSVTIVSFFINEFCLKIEHHL